MRIIVQAASTLVLGVVLVGQAHAQDVAEKTTTVPLVAVGTTQLTSPDLLALFGDDLRIRPEPQVDEAVPLGESAAALSLTFPTPTPQAISPPPRGFSGFQGISHRDQRLAGTGAFTNTQFSSEPPDQALAAGNGFILEAVNSALAVYDQRTGALLVGPTPLNQFFNLAPAVVRSAPPIFGDFVSDPRAYFDRLVRRWFVTVLQIDVDPTTGDFGTRSHVLVAVSQTSDPRGAFNLFSIDTTDDGRNGTQNHPICPCFGDQPLIGADTFGFFISTNEFAIQGNPFVLNRAQIYAISKLGLVQGSLPQVVHLSGLAVPGGGRGFSVQPATSPDLFDLGDDGTGTEFFLSSFNTQRFTNQQIVAWALTNTRSLGFAHPSVQITNLVIPSQVFTVPPDATQKVGPIPLGALVGEPELLLATNEHRMQQVVLARGQLWSAVTTGIQQGDNLVAGAAFFVVDVSARRGNLRARVAHQGYVSVAGQNVFYPSIGVTEDGAAVMGVSLAGPDFFPSAAFTRIDPFRGAGAVRIAGAGAAPDDGFSGYAAFGGAGSGRWGDYSAAVADGDTVWFANQYIPGGNRTQLANWGTFVGSLGDDD
jgi:hypothetical protein